MHWTLNIFATRVFHTHLSIFRYKTFQPILIVIQLFSTHKLILPVLIINLFCVSYFRSTRAWSKLAENNTSPVYCMMRVKLNTCMDACGQILAQELLGHGWMVQLYCVLEFLLHLGFIYKQFSFTRCHIQHAWLVWQDRPYFLRVMFKIQGPQMT